MPAATDNTVLLVTISFIRMPPLNCANIGAKMNETN